jgi:hypothetical protein
MLHRLSLRYPLPLGHVATIRRLLKRALGKRARTLVIGDPGPVRQAWPSALLDVVGTAPDRTDVTVVSDAEGEGSLPRRWDLVVVTEGGLKPDRLRAAVGACVQGGLVAVLTPSSSAPALPEQVQVERVVRSRRLHLVVASVPK